MTRFLALLPHVRRLLFPVAVCLAALLVCDFAHARPFFPFRQTTHVAPVVEQASNHWPLTIGACLLVAVVSYPIFRFLASRYQKLVALRKNAAVVAAALKSYGLNLVPDFLTCFAANDPQGMVQDIEKAAHVFSQSPDAVVKELDGVFSNVLSVKLQSTAGRAALQAALTAANQTPAKS